MENGNSVAEFWEKNKTDYAGDVLAPEIIRLSKKFIGKKVLDAGAGSGALISRIPGAIGIDLAPKSRDVVKGDITKMSFKDGNFDTVFATEVLEHLSDEILKASLKEIKRVLNPGGIFIITVPYKENIEQNTIECPKCGESFHRWGHLQSFDEIKMGNILKSNGFAVIKINALPLGSMARHPFLRNFRWFLKKIGRFQSTNLFVISRNE